MKTDKNYHDKCTGNGVQLAEIKHASSEHVGHTCVLTGLTFLLHQ